MSSLSPAQRGTEPYHCCESSVSPSGGRRGAAAAGFVLLLFSSCWVLNLGNLENSALNFLVEGQGLFSLESAENGAAGLGLSIENKCVKGTSVLGASKESVIQWQGYTKPFILHRVQLNA